VPAPLVAASAAELLDLTGLRYDVDFAAVASVTGQRCRSVVGAGDLM